MLKKKLSAVSATIKSILQIEFIYHFGLLRKTTLWW
jgi:hypothetical protein